MPQEPDDKDYTPDESRLKTSFRECIPLFIALGDSTRLTTSQSAIDRLLRLNEALQQNSSK